MERRLALFLGAAILTACSRAAEINQESAETPPRNNPNNSIVFCGTSEQGSWEIEVKHGPEVEIVDAEPTPCQENSN